MNSEKLTREQLLDNLQEVLIGMKVPSQRTKDIGWLDRNLAIYNSDHPNFLKAVWLIKQLKGDNNK